MFRAKDATSFTAKGMQATSRMSCVAFSSASLDDMDSNSKTAASKGSGVNDDGDVDHGRSDDGRSVPRIVTINANPDTACI
jgi:hypothetical protein